MEKELHIVKRHGKKFLSDTRLEPCPFCGTTPLIIVIDDEGNIKQNPLEYMDNPYSGIQFGIFHIQSSNSQKCPIYHESEECVTIFYNSLNELIESWNKRQYQSKTKQLEKELGKNIATKYVYHPKTREELKDIVSHEFELQGGVNVDLNCIDTSSITDMSELFYSLKYSDLESLDLSNWDVSNVKDMTGMFCNCENLKSVGNLSNWNVSNVHNMSGMFLNCESLISLDLSEWDMSKVENMEGMFWYCKKLTSVGDLSQWDVSKVKDMQKMFALCDNLTSVGDLSGWVVSAVEDMHGMFLDCASLKSVGDLSRWDVSKVEDVSYMFYNCSRLTPIRGLDNWNVDFNTNMYRMFDGCPKFQPVWYRY